MWSDLVRIYATKVTPEEILYLVTNMARLREKGQNPDFYTAMHILTDVYNRKKNAGEKCFVIMERMQCLQTLLKQGDERMRGWTVDSIEPDCMLTNHAVFAATALCPMGEETRPELTSTLMSSSILSLKSAIQKEKHNGLASKRKRLTVPPA